MAVRFLHTADWQIGMPARFMSEEAATRYTEARLDAIRTLGRLAAERECAFVVVAGDVFDANLLRRQTILRAMEAMAEIRVPLYLLPGNHDPLDPSSVYRSPDVSERLGAGARILEDARPVPVAPGVELVPAPWPSKRPDRDLVWAAVHNLPADGTLRVVVGHGAVDRVMGVMADVPSTIRLDRLETAIAEGRVHYVALGDRHSTLSVGDSGRVWYSGTTEPTRFDESDPGNVLVVELDGPHVAVQPVHVGRWRFVALHVALTGAADVDALAAHLTALPDKTRTLVRLALTGTLSLRDHAALERLLSAQGELFAGLEVHAGASDLAVQPDDFDFSSLNLAGFARAAMDELAARAAGADDEAAAAQGALSLLYRLAGGEGA